MHGSPLLNHVLRCAFEWYICPLIFIYLVCQEGGRGPGKRCRVVAFLSSSLASRLTKSFFWSRRSQLSSVQPACCRRGPLQHLKRDSLLFCPSSTLHASDQTAMALPTVTFPCRMPSPRHYSLKYAVRCFGQRRSLPAPNALFEPCKCFPPHIILGQTRRCLLRQESSTA